MLGYNAVNAALQSLSVREKVYSYLSLYFLFSFPSFKLVEERSTSIDKLTEYFLLKFEKEFKKEELNLLYLAAIFDIDPKYDFAKFGDKEDASCQILEEGKGYLNKIFQETLAELAGGVSVLNGRATYKDYLSQLKVLNIPTSRYMLFKHKVNYPNGAHFTWTPKDRILVNPNYFASSPNIDGNRIKNRGGVFNSIQTYGTNFNFKKLSTFSSLKTTASEEFLKLNEKFFFEIYFIGDSNLKEERYLSFEEAFFAKEYKKEFVITGVGVRLMNFLSPDEILKKGFQNSTYNQWFQKRFEGWSLESFDNAYGEREELGYSSKEGQTGNIDSTCFEDLLISNSESSINLISKHEDLIYDKAMVVNYDTDFISVDPNKEIYTRFPVILKKSELKDKKIDLKFKSLFDSFKDFNPKLTTIDDERVDGKIKELYHYLKVEADTLINNIIENDADVGRFFTKIIPIETLLTLGPIYYSSLAEETGIREELKNLDGFVYKDYLKSINDLLENLSKFDEY